MTNNNSFYSNENISTMYPYGEFPTKYTKNKSSLETKTNTINTQGIDTEKHNEEKPSSTNFDKLLPIITALSSGKKMESGDLFSSILPLIAGSNAKQITPLLNLLNTKNSKNKFTQDNQKPLPPSNYNSIDSYERI